MNKRLVQGSVFAAVMSVAVWGQGAPAKKAEGKSAAAGRSAAAAGVSASAAKEESGAQSPGQAAERLPVKRVVLYKNGVGYFEHLGRVRGNGELNIDFTTAQLNDVLKSLTAVDLGGGRIAGVRYNSIAPLAERLKSLRLPVGAQTDLAGFLSQLRGARVEVRSGTATASGRILSVDQKERSQGSGKDAITVDVLSLVSDAGEVRNFDLTPATSVRLADRDLNQEVGKYLQLLNSAREQDIRRMSIASAGAGERDLFVSYISEVPVWKSTYRILLPSKAGAKPLLQGWAIVDNTVGEDWRDVELSLVAGAPQSFVQNLAQPYYLSRPVVGLPQQAMLTPQSHEGTQEAMNIPSPAAAPPPPMAKAMMTPGIAGGGLSSFNGSRTGNQPEGVYYFPGSTALAGLVFDQSGAEIANASITAIQTSTNLRFEAKTNSSGQFRISGIPASNYDIIIDAAGFKSSKYSSVAVSPSQITTINARLSVGKVQEVVEVSEGTNENREDLNEAFAEQASGASGKELGDLFEYKLKDRVTIGKNQSALVPIVHANVEAEKVTLWNAQTARPLRALWLNNSSGLTLDGGSFNVVDEDAFAGEGLMDVVKPGERRLLSYALDQAVRVEPKQESERQRVSKLKIAKGVILQTTEIKEHTVYSVRNEDTAARTVVVEHPARPGWKLAESAKPEETTASFLRFKVKVDPKQTAKLTVDESLPQEQQYAVTNLDDNQINFFLSEKSISPETEKALRAITAKRNQVADFQNQINQRQQEWNSIVQEQARLRENMKALKGSAEEKALLQRYTRELNDQEDRVAALRAEIKDLEKKRDAAQEELNKMAWELEVE